MLRATRRKQRWEVGVERRKLGRRRGARRGPRRGTAWGSHEEAGVTGRGIVGG